jgi:hypothetical protein
MKICEDLKWRKSKPKSISIENLVIQSQSKTEQYPV